MQQLLTQLCTTVINIENNFLETDKSNKIVESRALVTKAADAITIMGTLNIMVTNERKTRLNQHFLKVTRVFVTRISPSQYIF